MKLALFDLDHTLLPLDSDHAWGQFTVKLGWRDADAFGRANDVFYQQYKAGTLDIAQYVDFATAALREQGWQKAQAAHAQFMQAVIEPAIRPQALELIRQHQQAGDHVVIVTATNEFVTRPIAQRLGVQHLVAINLERDEAGVPTGRIQGVPSFREGKVTRVEQWLANQGATWADVEQSTFYSDSINDLPLMERVSHPVATNPDASLLAVAEQRGWRILHLFQ
jgi:HAD superfamily hydrolase (TIGR01490 family)